MDRTVSMTAYLNCLTEIYNDFKKHGSITSIKGYADYYHCNNNLAAALKNEKLIREVEGKPRTYLWIGNEPDEPMVLRVKTTLNNLTIKNSHKKDKINIIKASNLTSLTNYKDYKQNLRAAYKLGHKYIKDENKIELFVDEFLEILNVKPT